MNCIFTIQFQQMKIIISPAKSLDFESKVPTSLNTQARFLEQSEVLNKQLKRLSKKELSKLMKISDDLSALNYDRNQLWKTPFTPQNAKQAIYAFTGAVFKGIDVNSLAEEKTPFTPQNAKQAIYAFTGAVFKGIDVNSLAEEKIPLLQDNLRILSGLYGILKPLDLIQPYRLEMGTKLPIGKTENLYKFWDDTVANALNEELENGELLVNLASAEYFKVIPKKVLKVPMITPIFKDFKNGEYKIVMTFAKKARGLMVRYLIDNNIKTIEGLKGFNKDRYRFSEEMSLGNELVFTR